MHAVIFDIDGTLLQSAAVDDALYRQAVSAILGPVQFRESLAHYRLVTDGGILAQILIDNDLPHTPDPSVAVKAQFVELLRRHVRTHGPFVELPGARKLLNELRKSERHAVAIATGGWRDTALLKLTSARFDIGGIPLASSDDHHDRTEIMRTALEQLGTSVTSVTYFGDGPWDRDACRSLGWEFVAVGPELGGIDSFADLATLPGV